MTASAWLRAAGVDSGRDGGRQRAVSSGRVRVGRRGEQRAGEERGASRGRRGGLLLMQGEGGPERRVRGRGHRRHGDSGATIATGKKVIFEKPPGSKEINYNLVQQPF